MTTIPAAGNRQNIEHAIVDVARDVLAREGIDALSMRVVADRVGVSATAIYRYFDSKQDLIDHVVLAGYRRFDEYLAEAMEVHPTGAIERLKAFGGAYIRFALENKSSFQVLFSIRTSHPKAIEELTQEGGFARLRRSVIDAIEAGVIPRCEPSFVTLYLLSMAHGLVTLEFACNFEKHECTPDALRIPLIERFERVWSIAVGGLRSSDVTQKEALDA